MNLLQFHRGWLMQSTVHPGILAQEIAARKRIMSIAHVGQVYNDIIQEPHSPPACTDLGDGAEVVLLV